MDIKKGIILLLSVVCMALPARSQDVAFKTNVLPDLALSPNFGIEIGLAPRWSLDATGQYNLWTVDGRKWKHWLVQPEARYWFCDRFVKSFVGVHAIGVKYNVGHMPNNLRIFGKDFSQLSDYRFQGWAVGAGVAYGYAIPLGVHWNLELEIGAGYVYTMYDKYECTECGRKVDTGDYHYVGPTKAAINLVYLF